MGPMPQIRIVGLLVITFFVSLCAILVRYTGVMSIVVTYVFAPSIVAGIISQIEWPKPWRPLKIIRTTLVIMLVVSLLLPISVLLQFGAVAGIAVLCWQTALTLLFWMPQYFVVVSTYE